MIRYDIRNYNIVLDLQEQGFTIYNTSPGIWTMEAPADLSSTKARKLISVCIKLYAAAKEMSRATKRYKNLVYQIDALNASR